MPSKNTNDKITMFHEAFQTKDAESRAISAEMEVLASI